MSAPRPNPLTWPLRSVGFWVLWVAEVVGGMTLTFGAIVRAMFPPRFDRRELWRNLYKVGVKSFPIVVITALFTGAIMVIQSGEFIRKSGATGLLGWGAGLAVFAELGPVMIGLMFSGRVGANNTAELGTMVVTEQVDALRALAIDPVEYLVVPRFLAMMLMLGLLTVLGDFFAVLGGAITSQVVLDVHWRLFLGSVFDSGLLLEFLVGIVKSTLFGVSISVVSCYYGLNVRGGATGVGRAVNSAVVSSAVAIFVVDYLCTYTAVTFGWL